VEAQVRIEDDSVLTQDGVSLRRVNTCPPSNNQYFFDQGFYWLPPNVEVYPVRVRCWVNDVPKELTAWLSSLDVRKIFERNQRLRWRDQRFKDFMRSLGVEDDSR
jgi:hypothetical protein